MLNALKVFFTKDSFLPNGETIAITQPQITELDGTFLIR